MNSTHPATPPSLSLARRPFFTKTLGTLTAVGALYLAGCASAFCQTNPVVKLTRLDDRVRIEVEGKLFTEYLFGTTLPRPVLYPLLAADGTKMTRDFPMADVPGEEQDHPHHRSLWWGHGSVNGTDFWLESDKTGKIVQESLVETKSGKVGVLRAKRRWETPEKKVVATDELTLRIQAVPQGRLLDYEITLTAPKDSPIVFGDTKEGTMAIRLPQWMTLPHKFKGKMVDGTGKLVSSGGDEGTAVWGKRAEWADYFGPYRGKTYGVAIFDHPTNPRHPTWWHARDYGLFAANPFGRHDFEGLKDRPKAGDYTVPAGEKVTFRYRIYIHEGATAAAGVAERYKDYRAGK